MKTRRLPLWTLVAGTLLFSGCGEAPRVHSSSTAAGQSPQDASAAASPIFSSGAATSANGSPALPAEQPAEITIAMEDCKASRPGKISGTTSLLSLLFSGPPKDKLVKRGTVPVDGQTYTLYLPRAESYSTTNTEEGDSDFENTSTLLSIDHNGDGKLTEDEGWFANLPLRLGDKMFDVAEIAADGSRIVLKPSQSPLRGVILGRTCPPFSFETADGGEVSRETLAGRAFILDIWSFT
jgi:hypothetical protein